MVKKFLFLLTQEIAWKSAVKALLFGVWLYWGAHTGFSVLKLLLWFGFLAVLYIREKKERPILNISFWLFPAIGATALHLLGKAFPGSGLLWGASALCAALFFVFLYIRNFRFKNTPAAYTIWNTLLLFLSGLCGFSIGGFFGWGSPLFLFFTSVLLMQEGFRFFGLPGRHKNWSMSFLTGFLAVQFSFLLYVLPLGFVNAAAVLTMILFLVRDTLVMRAKGELDLPFMFREVVFFVLLTILVFAASTWQI